jgi:Domain of unknown function (DUF4082)
MEKKTLLLTPTISKTLAALICALVLSISCKKETSGTTPPPPPPVSTTDVSLFTSDGPAGFTQRDTVPGGIELGLKFKTSIAGKITGIRFWKARGNSGVHTGLLYTTSGSVMASKDFTNETDSGWQKILFDAPVTIQANTTYIAAYFSSMGYYSGTKNGLKASIINGPLTAPADGVEGINGLYKYTNTPSVPDTGFVSSNYWVDLILNYPNN